MTKTQQRARGLTLISLLLMVWPLTATPLQGRNPTTEQLSLQDIWGVAVRGNRAYLAGYRGIAIVDLTDGAQPRVVREVSLPGSGFGGSPHRHQTSGWTSKTIYCM